MPELVPFAVDRADITPYYEALDAALSGTGPALAPYEAGTPAPDVPRHPEDAPERLALVVATSGSTGTPKRAMLTRDALVASATATHDRIGAGTWLLPLPPHHIAGTQVVVRSLIAGTTPTVLDAWSLEMFTKATALVARNAPPFSPIHTSLVPTQLRDVLDADGAVGEVVRAEARRYRSILVGGAATPPDLHARALDAGLRIVTTYGSSETAGGCAYDSVPLRGVDLLALDDAGRPVSAPGTVGRIAVTGPTLATGYLGDATRRAEAFVTLPDGRRAFITDDLGSLDADGHLSIESRADDVIVTGGYKVSPHLVEDAFRSLDGVHDAVALARPHERWGQAVAVAIVTAPGVEATPPTLERLITESRKTLPPYAVPTLAKAVDTIPLRGVGKPDRASLAAQDGWHNLRR